MRLLPISQKMTAELKKVENAKKVDKAPKGKGLRAEKPEFSAGARRLSETSANADIVASQLSNQPDVRTEKVEEVRQKIESGYYNSAEFVDKLAEKLMGDFGLNPPQQ